LIHKYRVALGTLTGYELDAFRGKSLRSIVYTDLKSGDALVTQWCRGGDVDESVICRRSVGDRSPIVEDIHGSNTGKAGTNTDKGNAGNAKRVSELVSEEGAAAPLPASPSGEAEADRATKEAFGQDWDEWCSLVTDLVPQVWEDGKAELREFKAALKLKKLGWSPATVREFWVWNQKHKAGKMKFTSLNRVIACIESDSDRSGVAQFHSCRKTPCPKCKFKPLDAKYRSGGSWDDFGGPTPTTCDHGKPLDKRGRCACPAFEAECDECGESHPNLPCTNKRVPKPCSFCKNAKAETVPYEAETDRWICLECSNGGNYGD